ncbi:TIGR03747 family integrating conjugative element membrane protein [Vibrio europaeus]|uniref:TIGR03747 family integrating conjugative element membrane protein n=1 Tax=Vibrio europaeus TaxID=300876 RepID=UPI00233F65B1|nr:TIGR03747 family integrating conjugative element membrane protein [Vibrio europaeus]MDC5870287.1 TIGR03747 family integrating conjugative element membrane protein [Vibrio europaeus]
MATNAQGKGTQQRKEASRTKDLTLSGRFIAFLIALPTTLFFSLLLSIFIEWVGINTIWKHQGVVHSKNMYISEVKHVNKHFRKRVVASSPAKLTKKALIWTERNVFHPIGLTGYKNKNKHNNFFWRHAISAYYMMKVLIVRCCVLLFSLPVFLLFALVGVVVGLVKRDLRRFGAGRESSDRFEVSRKLVFPCVGLCMVIYISYPSSINPAFIIVPFAAMFGYAVHLTFSNYKKYF